jgi:hypothetical protein
MIRREIVIDEWNTSYFDNADIVWIQVLINYL